LKSRRYIAAGLSGLLLVIALSSGSVALAKPRVGAPAPLFHLVTLKTDALVSLEDLVYPGEPRSGARRRPVLLDFFSTDCPPCKKGLPRLVALYRQISQQRGAGAVQFFIVALPERKAGRKKIEAYFKKHPVPFQVLVDKYGTAAKAYSATAKEIELPVLFVVDRRGILRRRIAGVKGARGYKKLKRLLVHLIR